MVSSWDLRRLEDGPQYCGSSAGGPGPAEEIGGKKEGRQGGPVAGGAKTRLRRHDGEDAHPVHVRPNILKMTLDDERTREWWATHLGPCLIGEAQAAYRAMMYEAAMDYDLVKQAILQDLDITEEIYRLRFWEYQRPPRVRPHVVGQQLTD